MGFLRGGLFGSCLEHASHELHRRVVSKTQIQRISRLSNVQNGPTDAGRFVGCLEGKSHHRFAVPFTPGFGRRRHQKQKETAFVDDRRCGRYCLVALEEPLRDRSFIPGKASKAGRFATNDAGIAETATDYRPVPFSERFLTDNFYRRRFRDPREPFTIARNTKIEASNATRIRAHNQSADDAWSPRICAKFDSIE